MNSCCANPSPSESEPTPASWRTVWGLVLLTILAAIPRAGRLHQVVHMDEDVVLDRILRAPVWKTLTEFEAGANHPLYNLLARLTSCFGSEFAWCRLPALAAGVAVVPLLVVVLRQHVGVAPAYVAAAALALTRHQIEYAALARGYSLAVLGATISCGLLLAAIHSDRRLLWFAYAFSTALAVYAHLWSLIMIAGQISVCLLMGRRLGLRETAKFAFAVGFALAAALVLYSPMLIDIVRMLGERGPLPFALRMWEFVRDNSIMGQPTLGMGNWTVAIHVSMLGTIVLALALNWPRLTPVVHLHAGIIVVALVMVTVVRPAIFFPRYLFFVFPSYVSVFAAAMSLLLLSRSEPVRAGRKVLSDALSLSGLVVAASTVALLCVYPTAPRAWGGLFQLPQVGGSLLLLSWLAAPLERWRRHVTFIGLAVAGCYSAGVLATELVESPLDRTITALVAIALGFVVIVESSRRRVVASAEDSLQKT